MKKLKRLHAWTIPNVSVGIYSSAESSLFFLSSRPPKREFLHSHVSCRDVEGGGDNSSDEPRSIFDGTWRRETTACSAADMTSLHPLCLFKSWLFLSNLWLKPAWQSESSLCFLHLAVLPPPPTPQYNKQGHLSNVHKPRGVVLQGVTSGSPRSLVYAVLLLRFRSQAECKLLYIATIAN